MLGEIQQPQARAVTLFGMRAVLKLPLHHLAGPRSDVERPVEQPPRGPLAVLAVGFGHVLGERGVTPAQVGSHMHGHPLAFEEALDRGGGKAHLELVAHQAMRDAVIVAVDLDVIVDVHDRALPLGELVACRRKRRHGGAINRGKGARPRAFELLERAVVQIDKQFADRRVEFGECEERAVSEPRENPALHQQHARLDGGFVAGVKRARGQNRRAVVARHVGVGGGRLGFIAAGALDRALQIIGHQQCRYRAEEFEGTDVRANPVRQRLREARLRVGVIRGAQHGDEDLGYAQLAAARIDDRHRVAAIVEKQLLAGAVHLTHRAFERLAKLPVVEAELAVAVGATGVRGVILLPQQRKGDALAFEFLVNMGKVGRGVACRGSARAAEQLRLQRRVVHLRSQRPADARLKGALQVAGDRCLGHTGGGGNTLMTELGLEFEAQDFFDLAHGFPFGGHLRLRKKSGKITRRS